MAVSRRPYHHTFLLVGLLLGLASTALARSHDDYKNIGIDHVPGQTETVHPELLPSNSTFMEAQSYFRHREYSALIVAHIVFMLVGWVFILPLVVVLSIVRSRLSLPIHILFFVVNGLGVLLAIIYNSNTPDLYAHNAHYIIGWIMTWVVCLQTSTALICAYGRRNNTMNTSSPSEQVAFIPISTVDVEEHGRNHGLVNPDYRFSDDGGQGTEWKTESLRSQPVSSTDDCQTDRAFPMDRKHRNGDVDGEKRTLRLRGALYRFLSLHVLSGRILQPVAIVQNLINYLILTLGFIALTTGIVTYTGIFQGFEVFSGLAHFIKGGVFFWYGILTLGRWAGCFASLGWAWNIKPLKSIVGRHRVPTPSAEFVESFLIFFYGSTNIFLEHLGSWGQPWSAQDLEHISITVMFIGGGLCGMLIESDTVRELLSIPVQKYSFTQNHHNFSVQGRDKIWQQPKSYLISMNPLPALVVFLLGLLMSSHHQASMISTMVHKQWGILLAGAALSRVTTYIVFYLSPPTSYLPSRPPSELITAFCLMSGGIIFMASSHDTIEAMESNNVNAMFVFTVTTGLISFLMAWIISVIAIKGWATGRSGRVGFQAHPVI